MPNQHACGAFLQALKSARDVLTMASLIDKTTTCTNEVDKIDNLLNSYGINPNIPGIIINCVGSPKP